FAISSSLRSVFMESMIALRCDRAHRSAIAFQLSTQYAVEIRNGPERLNASMINTKTLALLFVLASSLIGASKDKDVKLDSGTCVRKVDGIHEWSCPLKSCQAVHPYTALAR